MTDLTGHGTLYDGDENELGAVAYRITHEGTDGGPIIAWAGELTFVEEDAVLEPGTYLLETEDGPGAKWRLTLRGRLPAERARSPSPASGCWTRPRANRRGRKIDGHLLRFGRWL